jgi:hypothetical protein
LEEKKSQLKVKCSTANNLHLVVCPSCSGR